MNKTIFVSVIFAIALLLAACSESNEKKLIGTWKVSDVQTEFNESQVTPEMLKQVVDRQKQTYFRIINDTTMVIISNNNTHEATWMYDDEDQSITYFFEGLETKPNKLGKFDGVLITSESKTPMGKIVIQYSKQ